MFNQNKKGFLSFFIIMGLIILFLAIFVIVIQNQKKDDIIVESNLDVIPIKSYVESVIESVLLNSSLEVLKNGGYSDDSLFLLNDDYKFYLSSQERFIPYSINYPDNILRDIETIQSELSNVTLERIKSNLDFSFFINEYYYEFIDLDKAKDDSFVDIFINNETIFVIYNIDLKFKKNNAIHSIKQLRLEAESDFGLIVYKAHEIVNNIISNNGADLNNYQCNSDIKINYYFNPDYYIRIRSQNIFIDETKPSLEMYFGLDDEYNMIDCN